VLLGRLARRGSLKAFTAACRLRRSLRQNQDDDEEQTKAKSGTSHETSNGAKRPKPGKNRDDFREKRFQEHVKKFGMCHPERSEGSL
jgi:hypothetical protein